MMWEWTLKKPECQRTDAFELPWWRRLLRVPRTARRSNQSILKEINPEPSMEGLMLKLKLQYLATWWDEQTHWRRPWCWERLRAGGEGDDRGRDVWMESLTQWTRWKVKSFSHVRLIATPQTVTYQALPSMGFSRQEYWSGLPFPSPEDLPNPGIEPRSPAL